MAGQKIKSSAGLETEYDQVRGEGWRRLFIAMTTWATRVLFMAAGKRPQGTRSAQGYLKND